MKYRKLGRSELLVSEIGLGCSGFWGDRHFSERKALRVVERAFEEGVNFFDTGSNYSNFNAEPRLGRALKTILGNNKRESVVLSTKAGSTLGYAPTVEDDDTRSADFSPCAIERSCVKSIGNLNSEYLDVFQLHGFDTKRFTSDLAAKLVELKKKGLIKTIGVNTHFNGDLEFVLQYPDVFDMVLTDCNVLQLDRFEIIDKLASAGIGVVVGTVLAQGYLVRRKIGSIRTGSYFYYLARTVLKPTTRNFARSATHMRRVLKTIPEMSAAQASFACLLRRRSIASCLFGTTEVKNLTEVAGASGKVLSPESVKRIEDAFVLVKPGLSR